MKTIMKPFKINMKKLVIGGFSALIALVIIAGAAGLYAIRSSAADTAGYIEAVDIARKVQIDFQRQFYLWNSLVLRGDISEDFRKNYHAFSYQADRVKDALFNLKMLCLGLGIPADSIQEMTDYHAGLTEKYIAGLNMLERKNFMNRNAVLARTLGMDESALRKMDELVTVIERDSSSKIGVINSYYLNTAIIAFIILSVFLIAVSAYISRIILTAQDRLAEKVRERTFELAETNIRLLGANEELEELEEAYKRISLSEERYRMLVEGSNNIIFTMNNEFIVQTCSKAVYKHLKVRQSEVEGGYFLDMMYNRGEDGAAADIIMEKLTEFKKNRKPVGFRMSFRSFLTSEPAEMDVRLEFLEISGRTEILGVASIEAVDALEPYFISGSGRYEIGNYLTAADDVSRRITLCLNAFLDSREVNQIRVSLREMIINSIEHGNLGISFSDKSAAQESDTYFSLLAARQRDPELSSRRVTIEYSVNGLKAVCKIADEGMGFDHEKYLGRYSPDSGELQLCHGRGIIMAKSVFSEIRYNRSGNQVLLVKNLTVS